MSRLGSFSSKAHRQTEFIVMRKERVRCHALLLRELGAPGTNLRKVQDAELGRHKDACTACRQPQASIFYCYVEADTVESACRVARELFPDRFTQRDALHAETILPGTWPDTQR